MILPPNAMFLGRPLVQVYELAYELIEKGRGISITFRTNKPRTVPSFQLPVTNIVGHTPLRILFFVESTNVFPELSNWVGQNIYLENRTDNRVLEFE